jgi:hypothetical protein
VLSVILFFFFPLLISIFVCFIYGITHSDYTNRRILKFLLVSSVAGALMGALQAYLFGSICSIDGGAHCPFNLQLYGLSFATITVFGFFSSYLGVFIRRFLVILNK